jgi:ABC-type transport system substrate-binding protein
MQNKIRALGYGLIILIGIASSAAYAMGGPPPTAESAAAIFTARGSTETLSSTAAGSTEVEYDGLWFLGFNHHKDIFGDANGITVKKAVGLAMHRQKIVSQIMGECLLPDSFIPPGMDGYSSGVFSLVYSTAEARALLKKAGYSTKDKRLKNLSLLHTDGIKTIAVAKQIKSDLAALGIKVELVQVAYRDTEKWQAALESGKFHMFLMGYKATKFTTLYIGDKKNGLFHTLGCAKTPDPQNQLLLASYAEALGLGLSPCKLCNPAPEPPLSTYDLLEPLFHVDGAANFAFFDNPHVNNLFDQIAIIDVSLKDLRTEKFKQINLELGQSLPVIPLFYITKL